MFYIGIKFHLNPQLFCKYLVTNIQPSIQTFIILLKFFCRFILISRIVSIVSLLTISLLIIIFYNFFFSVSTVVRNYGGALKAPAALLRLRLYQACGALGGAGAPAAPLLRLLAAELAGSADPSGANVATGD